MARRPRLEFPGAIYYVTNGGNGRPELFGTAGAAKAFVECLVEVCERMGWELYAYCLARDRYHLAIGTPRANLVAGVHWLQSTFGNRLRAAVGGRDVGEAQKERRRTFRGRYQAFLVEAGAPLAWVVDFIHAEPVRAGMVSQEQLERFRWSSLRWFVGGKEGRPGVLREAGLTGSGVKQPGQRPGLQNTGIQNAGIQGAEFGVIGVGWALGSVEYREAILGQLRDVGRVKERAVERSRSEEAEWMTLLEAGVRFLGRDLGDAAGAPMAADWKVALAAWMKGRCGVSNRWLGKQLRMGAADAVSRYVGEVRKGLRGKAKEEVEMLKGVGL